MERRQSAQRLEPAQFKAKSPRGKYPLPILWNVGGCIRVARGGCEWFATVKDSVLTHCESTDGSLLHQLHSCGSTKVLVCNAARKGGKL